MGQGYNAQKEDALRDWALQFAEKIVATPLPFGYTPAMAAAMQALAQSFAQKLAVARDPATRTSLTVESKNVAKRQLRELCRKYASIAYGQGLSNEQLMFLGLAVRYLPQPIPAPSFAPVIDSVSMVGRLWTIRLHAPGEPTKRGLPVDVDGISVFWAQGEIAPTDPTKFTFAGNTTRGEVQIVLPESLAPGTKVWATAFYFSPRKESGPACDPVSAVVQYGGMNVAV